MGDYDECCGKCKYHKWISGYKYECNNSECDCFTDYTDFDDGVDCEYFEEKEN